MPFKEPFILGPFSVDPEGRLSPAHAGLSPGFNVRWHGRVVHALLDQCEVTHGRLRIRSSLGRIPSTASDPATRLACIATLSGLQKSLPRAWVARLLPDHQPQLESESVVSLPITVTDLVVELTLCLLALSPYLDLMDRAGVTVVDDRVSMAS